MKNGLINDIHSKVWGLHIKNLKLSVRNKKTYGWFTLKHEKAGLTCRMLAQIKSIVEAISGHFAISWDDDEDELAEIELTKLDVA